MAKPVWRIWARNQGLSSAFCLLAGGIISLFYPAPAYGYVYIAVSILVFLFDYPAPFMFQLGVVFSNLYVRAVLYFLLCIVGFLQAPTVAGCVFLLNTAVTYAYAARVGEEWKKEEPKKGRR